MVKDIRDVSGAIEDGLGALMASFEVPGLAVGIVKDGEVAYAAGFGVRSLATREPVTESSLFHMASISKPFVATALVQLFERGQLDLGAPVVEILPYFRLADERYATLTVQQMMSHLAGMPDVEQYGWEKPEYDAGALERYVRSLVNEKLIHAPGEKFAYSNMAFEVLGDVIAKTSGQSFEDFVETNLLRPLGMETSTFLRQNVPPHLATTPHVNVPRPEVSPVYPYHRAHAPSSTLHSSALEMGYWAIANLNHGQFGEGRRILRPENHARLWRPVRETGREPDEFVGLSWFIGRRRDQTLITHGGGDVGFNTQLSLLPEMGLGVVVLSNTAPAPVEAAANLVMDRLLGYEPEISAPPALLPVMAVNRAEGLEAAAAVFEEYRRNRPDDFDYGTWQFNDAAMLLAEIGRGQEALEVIELGLRIFPQAGMLYYFQAWVHEQRGEREPALESVRKCLALNPGNRHAGSMLERLSAGPDQAKTGA